MIASVPAPSSGAWKKIAPSSSFAAISVSPDCKVIVADEPSAVAKSLRTNLPVDVIVNNPPSVPAAADLPVANIIEAALLSAAKLPSETTLIVPAANRASVPAPSAGALKSICPNTSSAAISLSPAASVTNGVELSAVAGTEIVSPESATCVIVTSLSAPNLITEASEPKIKSSPTVKSPFVVKPVSAT